MSSEDHHSAHDSDQRLECLACGHVGAGRSDDAGGRRVAVAFAVLLFIAGGVVSWLGFAADGVILILLGAISVHVARRARPLRMCSVCGSGSVVDR